MKPMQWEHMAEPIKENAERFPDRVAVACGCESLTYGQLWSDVQAWACALRDDFGIERGDHVAYILPNGLDIATLYYAVQTLGGSGRADERTAHCRGDRDSAAAL